MGQMETLTVGETNGQWSGEGMVCQHPLAMAGPEAHMRARTDGTASAESAGLGEKHFFCLFDCASLDLSDGQGIRLGNRNFDCEVRKVVALSLVKLVVRRT